MVELLDVFNDIQLKYKTLNTKCKSLNKSILLLFKTSRFNEFMKKGKSQKKWLRKSHNKRRNSTKNIFQATLDESDSLANEEYSSNGEVNTYTS